MGDELKFNERLMATLAFSIGGASFTIAGGAIVRLSLDAASYGFSARVSFIVSLEGQSDELASSFNSQSVIRATLTLQNGRSLLAGESPPEAKFVGYVTERGFEETVSQDVRGQPIVERRYHVVFADAARVFWGCHRPLTLYANKSIKDVIDDNLVLGVTLSYDWPRLELAQDILCVGLGATSRASFYDFVIWLASDLCGVIELDAATGTYRLGANKASNGSATALDADCVATLRIVHPPVQREQTRVLNPFSEATATTIDVANSAAATGVRRDVVSYTQIAKVMEQRAQVEGDRLRQRDHHLHVAFRLLPEQLPVPGMLHTIGEGFSERLFSAGKTYRVIALRVSAEPPESDTDPVDLEDDCRRFLMQVTAELERDTDPVPNLPAFEPPVYPVLAEGRVLSASGTDTDLTWHALSSQTDSIVRYRIQVPLWNRIVVVPFVPFGESGHFFFPAQKHQRALLAFDFDGGKIVSFLDWVAKLGLDTQGNQLVMGKHETNRTFMRHAYTDDSSVFTLARNQAGDKQTFEFSDGRFFLEVKADEAQAPVNQTYDLTPQTEVAKDSAGSGARSALGDLTGKYQASMSSASGAFNQASGELETRATTAANALSGELAAVDDALSNASSDLGALSDTLTTKVASAKAELEQALEEN